MSMGKLNQTISWKEVGRKDNENHLDPAAALHSVQLMKIDTYPHSPSSSPTHVLDQQPSPDSEIHLTRRRNTIDMTQKYIWKLTLILTHRPLRQLSFSINSHQQTQEKKEHTQQKGRIHLVWYLKEMKKWEESFLRREIVGLLKRGRKWRKIWVKELMKSVLGSFWYQFRTFFATENSWLYVKFSIHFCILRNARFHKKENKCTNWH